MMLRALLLSATFAVATSQYVNVPNNRNGDSTMMDNLPAWYQMSKTSPSAVAAYPPFERREQHTPFERMPQHTNSYASYPTYGSRTYPENSLGSASSSSRRYGSAAGTDIYRTSKTSLERYHKLLLRRKLQLKKLIAGSLKKNKTRFPFLKTTTTLPSTTVVLVGNERSTMSTNLTTIGRVAETMPPFTATALPKTIQSSTTTTASTTTTTTTAPRQMETTSIASTTTTTSVKPSSTTKSSPKKSLPTINPTVPRVTTAKPVYEISSTAREVQTFKSLKPIFVTPKETVARKSGLLEYLMPNTELLAAIKDVVAKFKASLDETGIDQDMRHMGNQLKSTWQQLRTGPMNEQLGRMFERAADAPHPRR